MCSSRHSQDTAQNPQAPRPLVEDPSSEDERERERDHPRRVRREFFKYLFIYLFSLPLREVPSYEVLLEEMESLKRHLSQTDSPTVLCHNDLLTKNIIYNCQEGSVKFIDYEYADYNYQAFDIGNHFNEFAGVTDVDYSLYPSRELQRDWLTAYLESYKRSTGHNVTVSDEEVTKLYVQVCKFSLASNFFWGLWAILQSRFSSIDFDFQRFVHMLNSSFKLELMGDCSEMMSMLPKNK
uniref:ethanolamine kinase n=1 Tax=Poecilia mexicana TaxID=48701 RepID=A0A3B3Z4W1_9TELE